MKVALIVLAAVLVLVGLLAFHLFRPLGARPMPADFECYDFGQGAYVPLEVPPYAFGIGLSYAGHIEETASNFDPDASPPVFVKQPSATTRHGAPVHLPTSDELIETAAFRGVSDLASLPSLSLSSWSNFRSCAERGGVSPSGTE